MTLVEAVPAPPPAELGRVHLMGIGGAGMSGVAHILLERGISVSGCDAADSAALADLRRSGARISLGHDPGHLDDTDTLVLSSAIRATAPEVADARRRDLRVLPRAALLAAVMGDRRGVAVTGTHGKTTTTSLLALSLVNCGADPSYLVGGSLAPAAASARHGEGEVFVAEADESDGSFLLLSPDVAVVTNVEADHLDNYGTAEAVHEAFTRFLDRIRPGGCLVCCADDPGARMLAEAARRRGIEVRTYGESGGADVRVRALELSGLESAFDLVTSRGRHGRVRLRIPGRHNAVNAAGALATGLRLGYGFDELARGMAPFTGVGRRFEDKGRAGGVRVFDSYAHHPTELAADLRTARDIAGEGRVVAAFQPHLYSRTRFFAAEFGQALGLADRVVVLEVYAAREDPEPGVSGELVADEIPLPAECVRYEPVFDAVPACLAEMAVPGDVVVTLGAGDITHIGPRLVAALRAGQRSSGRHAPDEGSSRSADAAAGGPGG